MKTIDDIRRGLQLMCQTGTDNVFYAKVVSVDDKEYTCQVRRDDAVDYFDVRLRALVDSSLQGAACVPSVGSTVLVCRIGNSNELFVTQYSQIDKMAVTCKDVEILMDGTQIHVKVADTVLRSTTKGLTISRGSSGLKKTLNDLLTALQQLTVTTAVGPSGLPINIADFQKIQQDLTNYMEE